MTHGLPSQLGPSHAPAPDQGTPPDNVRAAEYPVLEAMVAQASLPDVLAEICRYAVSDSPGAAAAIYLRHGTDLFLAASHAVSPPRVPGFVAASAPMPEPSISLDLRSVAHEQLGRLTIFLPAADAPPVERLPLAGHFATLALEQRNLLEELQYRVTHDSLTGLLLRSAMPSLSLEPIAPESEEPWTLVLYLDLDGLGRVNEILGTLTADAVLRIVGRRIQSVLSPQDQAVRCGGDEFLIVLRGTRGLSEALPAADHVRRLISEPIDVDGQQLLITVSIGVAIVQPGDSLEKLERAGRIAANQAKKRGRNRIELYERSFETETSDRLLIERALRSASQDGSLQLWLQPKIRLADGKLAGVESLLRWRHPELGMVSPTKFIPIAEETGLVAQLGHWALREACRLHRRCREEGLGEIEFAVNVSPLQFHDPLLAQEIEATLREFAVSPQMVELEITETALIEHFSEVEEAIHGLRSIGLRFAIDDFGTGHSSLAYINTLPVDAVKIDRSFIRHLGTRPGSIAFLESIIRLAHSLRFRVVVEGVETDLQHQTICDLGCDEGQGYLYSRPAPFDVFCQWAAQYAPLEPARSN